MTRARTKAGMSDETFRDLAEIEQRIRHYAELSARLRRQRKAEFDDGYIYLVEFSSGVLKPGKTGTPESRLAHHARLGRFHGVTVTRSWVSERHVGCSRTERKLLRFCEDTATRLSGEYFRDVRFEIAQAFGEWVAGAAQTKFLTEGAQETAAYVAHLSEAVGGDESKTLAEAHAAMLAKRPELAAAYGAQCPFLEAA